MNVGRKEKLSFLAGSLLALNSLCDVDFGDWPCYICME